VNKIISLCIISLFVTDCAHFLKRDPSPGKIPRRGVNIPEEAGEYPEVSEKDILRGKLSPFRSCYDVTYYNLSLALNIKNKSIIGNCQINAITQNDFDTLQVDLFDNMEILSIKKSEKALSFYRKHNAVFIEMPDMKKDSLFEITIQYEGIPEEAINPPWDGGFILLRKGAISFNTCSTDIW